MLAGSLGMLPSASLGERRTGARRRSASTSRSTARRRTSPARDIANPSGDDPVGGDDAALVVRAADAAAAAIESAVRGGARRRHPDARPARSRWRRVGARAGRDPAFADAVAERRRGGRGRGVTDASGLAPQPVVLYDTTLRDGTQGENITLSLADKLRIARMLDEYGMPYIEGGWPGSNPKDIEFFAAARVDDLAEREARRVRLHPPPREPADEDPNLRELVRGRDAGRDDLRQELAASRDRGPRRDARPRTWTWSPSRRVRRRSRARGGL